MGYIYNQDDVFGFVSVVGGETKTKGDELFFRLCPYCNGGKHSDKETFSINLNNGVFKCFRSSCNKQGHFVELARDFSVPIGNNNEKQEYRKLPQKNIEIRSNAIEYLKKRGISSEIAKKYKITTQTKNNNVLVFPFYDEKNILQFVKYRSIIKENTKNKEWCEKNTKPILFGMNNCEGFDQLVITEGQIDALSVVEAGFKNVVSVPTGANGFTWVKHCYDWLNKFKKVIVFGDNENGKISLIDKLNNILKCNVCCVKVEDYLFEKDANDILLKYGKQAIIKAINNAEKQDVKYIKRLSEIKKVDMMSLPKIKTGIIDLDRVIGGLYFGQVILLSGKRGEGKSTFMSQLVAEAIEQDYATFVYSGELQTYHFKNWLDLQIAGGKNVSVVKNEYGDDQFYLNDEVVEIINKWYHDKAFIFDNSEIKGGEFEGILKVLEKAICRYDIKLACIDNLMTALDDDANLDIYRKQSMFVKGLGEIARKYDIAIVLIAHPKKTKGEFENDTVSGSSDITNAVDVVMNYERAKEDDECDNKITVTKNRLTGKLLTGVNAVELAYSNRSKRIQSYSHFVKEKMYSCFGREKTSEEIVEELMDGIPF